MKFLNKQVLAFHAFRRCGESANSSVCQTDVTKRLDSFKRNTYEMRRSVCISPNYSHVTIDNDLMNFVEHAYKVLKSNL